MKQIFIIFFVILSGRVNAQELFVMTEPASNMPAGSLGFRDMNTYMFEKDAPVNYHNMPELMWGLNKFWMIHISAFFSNRTGKMAAEGGSLYAKYRFFSKDDIHRHFRLAAYGRFSLNNSDIHQDEIETMGHNTGYEIGLIATQLLKKVAVSSSLSFEKAFDNKPNYKFPVNQKSSAMNYSLSLGRLMYPVKYRNFDQTNINLMVELIAQQLNGNGKSFLDIAPAVQFIIKSRARVDLGYRQQLYTTMTRTAPNGFILKLEYNLFNVTK